jgi:hypothetical protein
LCACVKKRLDGNNEVSILQQKTLLEDRYKGATRKTKVGTRENEEKERLIDRPTTIKKEKRKDCDGMQQDDEMKKKIEKLNKDGGKSLTS